MPDEFRIAGLVLAGLNVCACALSLIMLVAIVTKYGFFMRYWAYAYEIPLLCLHLGYFLCGPLSVSGWAWRLFGTAQTCGIGFAVMPLLMEAADARRILKGEAARSDHGWSLGRRTASWALMAVMTTIAALLWNYGMTFYAKSHALDKAFPMPPDSHIEHRVHEQVGLWPHGPALGPIALQPRPPEEDFWQRRSVRVSGGSEPGACGLLPRIYLFGCSIFPAGAATRSNTAVIS